MSKDHERKIEIAIRDGPEPGDMILSVRQPYALQIVEGWKPVENRTWTTDYSGLLWIHASRGTPPPDWEREAIEDLGIPKREVEHWTLEYGAIVGAAYLERVYPFDLLPRHLSGNQHAVGPYCWHFTAADEIDPIPLRGKVGLFKFSN